MDNIGEEGFIQLTNYKDHPSNSRYKVYFFHQEERALYFENLMKEKSLPFEKDQDLIKGKTFYLYGVEKYYLDQAHECNFLTNANFRTPFLGKKNIKYLLSAVIIIILIFAIIGAAKS